MDGDENTHTHAWVYKIHSHDFSNFARVVIDFSSSVQAGSVFPSCGWAVPDIFPVKQGL
jgi:hypothetical protein